MNSDCTTVTRILPANERNMAEAARRLLKGEVIIFPTETVYGLGANALDDRAVARIFAIKQRPHFNPLIVHARNWADAAALVDFNPRAEALAQHFWPGGLTLVLPRRSNSGISLLASAGLDSIAVRVPAHPVARALLRTAGVPIAAPSANRAGRVSPTNAQACAQELNSRISLILDAGNCPVGIESTIIGFAQEQPVLLRPGAIERAQIEKIVGPLGSFAPETIVAPGMMRSHYAPQASLRLNALDVRSGEALLAFGRDVPAGAEHICNLSSRGDIQEAAANLFAMLRKLDSTGAKVIAVMPIPETGLGEAINDRLSRAAAPREAA
jgi:L-threonylcarbamoyladenylate synthase